MKALADLKILKILDNHDILLNDGIRGELLIEILIFLMTFY